MTASKPDRIRTDVLSTRLWDAVREGDEYAAADVLLPAVDAGLNAESALLDVIAPVQEKVGAEWAANRISVAQEHTATAINDRVIAALAYRASARIRPRRGRVTVACAEGEWHALPARLLAEILRLRGWQVDFLGAHVPVANLIDHLYRRRPDVLALSSSIPTRLPAAHHAITACQAAGVPVMVGGAAFGPGGRYATRLRADGWAPEGRTAALRLGEIVARAHVPPAAREPLDDLPHLADQEYTLVTRNVNRLVAAVLATLPDRFPDMADYSDRQHRHTAEELAYVTECLGAALYLDDSDLFPRLVAWTADILTARGVPAHSLGPALDLLTEQLKDFPRAVALLRDGRAALRGVPSARP
ncbi:cobalamin B12-binding domain-containing protein [Actinoallomurus soli]|uniref:cobalamin B12-binding domain-containing protein n=1 Tax=Actinoallomurus soli TaxID=2952535 RepID=UPI0020928C8F|nr:cobalamin-dependent protein [Actinoallomurus soli]MCO5971057.1 cobalamin-dependent protein [Actinoallomurus soli]